MPGPEPEEADTARVGADRTAWLTRGLPAPARVGVSFASAARPIVLAAVVGVAAIVAALTFGSSLRHLVSTPRLYGWTSDAVLFDDGGYGNMDPDATSDALSGDRDVEAWAAARFDVASVDGHAVPAMSFLPLRGDLAPPVLEGRGLQGPDEVMAGSRTLDELGLSVGDTVELEIAGEKATRRIVGRATLPAIGIVHGARTSLGDGFVLPAAPPDALPDPGEEGIGTAPSSWGSDQGWTRVPPATGSRRSGRRWGATPARSRSSASSDRPRSPSTARCGRARRSSPSRWGRPSWPRSSSPSPPPHGAGGGTSPSSRSSA